MTIKQIIETEGLDNIFKLAGWQGGTVHQAEEWIKERLEKHGIFEHKDTKELIKITIGE